MLLYKKGDASSAFSAAVHDVCFLLSNVIEGVLVLVGLVFLAVAGVVALIVLGLAAFFEVVFELIREGVKKWMTN